MYYGGESEMIDRKLLTINAGQFNRFGPVDFWKEYQITKGILRWLEEKKKWENNR